MNTSLNLLDISVAEAKELGQKVDYKFTKFTSNFSDGKSDGENNFKPIACQWFNSDYRQGYLLGIAKRTNWGHPLTEDRSINTILDF
jgi:hypothetical protein